MTTKERVHRLCVRRAVEALNSSNASFSSQAEHTGCVNDIAAAFEPTALQWAETLELVQAHLEELREAWQRGCIQETDGKGGTRSNRNMEMLLLVERRIAELERE